MRACMSLPENYRQIFLIDLKANKKQNGVVIVLALAMLVIAFVPAYFARPFNLADINLGTSLPQFITGALGTIIYMVLHEAVHGVLFWFFSGTKPTFGLSLEYAYAASRAYYGRRDYLIIGLAPVVLWGVVLAVICCVVPPAWFWPVQFIQLMNLSGAGGDVYVTWKLSRMPADMLVQDEGYRMTVYAPSEE